MYFEKFLITLNNSQNKNLKVDMYLIKIIFLNWILVSTLGAYAYNEYLMGFVNGGILFFLSLLLFKLYGGSSLFRTSIGFILPIYAMILVQENLGMIEAHFHFFVLLSFLTVYEDEKPLTLASLSIVLQHLLFTYFQVNDVSILNTPIIIYNYGCSYEIALIHGFFVFLEWIVLSNIIKNKRNTSKKLDEYKEKLLSRSLDIIDANLIASKTDLKGIIIEVTDKFCEISKYSKDELIGKSHNIVRDETFSSEIYKNMWSNIKNGKIWHGEIRNKDKNGNFYWVDTTVFPEYDSEDHHIGYASIRHDITSKKELEDSIKTIEEQHLMLLNQSKFSAMGEMISMIAHQWKQPLATLSTVLGKLKIIYELDMLTKEKFSDSYKKSEEIIMHMANTIEDFRNFFKDNIAYDEISIKELMEKSENLIKDSLNAKNIESNSTFKLDENLCLKLPISKFSQVILNIYKNALDAIVEKNIHNGQINVLCYENENQIIIEISDNAGGIPEEIIGRIFEPYFSTKSKNGTGIGLYMSKIIIEDHLKGSLNVSNIEDGACFTIKIPKKFIIG